MTEPEILLVAFYKARQAKLEAREKSYGPVSGNETQLELVVAVSEALPFLEWSNEEFDEILESIDPLKILCDQGWADSRWGPNNDGTFNAVEFTPTGLKKARELLEANPSDE